MHRVELKGRWRESADGHGSVPNAPCGVESYYCRRNSLSIRPFLMHRVELKVR